MANVLFKRGLLAALPTTGNAVDGVFYLTTDTNRLYIGDANSNLQLLNKTVKVVDSISDLTSISNNWNENERAAHADDFYYVKANGISNGESVLNGNILVIWNGTQWVQINPDTNTTVSSASLTTTTAANDVATVQVGLTDTESNSVTATMTISGTTGVHVAQSGDNLVISGRTYSLSESLSNASDAITISLGNSDTATTDYVKLLAGANVSFASTSNGVEISSTDFGIASVSLSSDTAGALALAISQNDSSSASASVANLGISLNDGSYVLLERQTSGSAGAIYSASEIDEKINGLNGMTFKGTIGDTGASTTALPTSNVKVGDVYLVAGDLTFATTPTWASGAAPSGAVQTGDMFIANGTEDSDTGYITSQTLNWSYVPSGNDVLDAYSYHSTVSTATNNISITNELGNGIAGIELVSGTGVVVSSTALRINNGDTSDNLLQATITHATVSTTSTTAASPSDGTSTFSAIKSITVDNGHVTAIETDTFTPVTYDLQAITTSATSNAATATFLTIDSGSTTGTSRDLNLETSSLQFGTNTATSAITVDLVWGTF